MPLTNPFQSPHGESISHRSDSPAERQCEPLRRTTTVSIGIIVGLLAAPFTASLFMLLVFASPYPHKLGFGSDFDFLWIIGLPIIAAPGGILSGALFGWRFGRSHAWPIAIAPAALLGVIFFLASAWADDITKNDRDTFVSSVVIATLMIGSAVISLTLVRLIFAVLGRKSVRN